MKMISNIVFTKNRPLQLEAYLESLYRYFPSELIQTYIIYKIELFEEQYNRLFSKYPNCTVIEENDFHSDFLKVVNQINTKFILFGIDDVVYFDSVNFDLIEECFNEFPDEIFGFSLRHSVGIIKDRDVIKELFVSGLPVFKFSWREGKTDLTSYPFELCATIYPTDLVRRVINSVINNNLLVRKLFSPGSALINVLAKVISTRSTLKSFGYFFSPNTLESWNCRWCQNHSDELPSFLYFQKQCATAIQVNMVNVTMRKTFDASAEYTVEALNEKYKHGYRLDIDFVSGNKPIAPHCGKEYLRLTKN